MIISIIAAIAEDNVIGNNNDLIWHISEDLKRFKKITSGHTIVMGRKTYESLPFKPLPNRKNIVISSQENLKFEGTLVVDSIDAVTKECKTEEEIFICGGAEIYKQFLPISDKLYITKIHHNFQGDTFFPEIDYSEWKPEFNSGNLFDEKSELTYSFIDYSRKK
jgi:dihydrofolate reductase